MNALYRPRRPVCLGSLSYGFRAERARGPPEAHGDGQGLDGEYRYRAPVPGTAKAAIAPPEGRVTYDPGYTSTASIESVITYIDAAFLGSRP